VDFRRRCWSWRSYIPLISMKYGMMVMTDFSVLGIVFQEVRFLFRLAVDFDE